jgi:HPt (histidine-containing phosphotransfer) domain-containing protein
VLLARLKEAVNDDDLSTYRQLAHAFKGHASSIGAIALYRACHKAQKMERADFNARAIETINEIGEEFATARKALERYLESSQSHRS